MGESKNNLLTSGTCRRRGRASARGVWLVACGAHAIVRGLSGGGQSPGLRQTVGMSGMWDVRHADMCRQMQTDATSGCGHAIVRGLSGSGQSGDGRI